MSRNEWGRWAVVGRVILVAFCAVAAVANAASIDRDRYLAPVSVVAVVCGVALLVPRLRWPVAPIVVTVATAWWGWPVLPLMLILLFDLAVDNRVRVAVGCVVAALGVNLLSYQATSLWTAQSYTSVLLLQPLAVAVGAWLGGRRRLVKALSADIEHLQVEARLREEAAQAAERSRIAAEMHDVLAHRLSLIALHTGVLTTKSDSLPAPVAERLALLRTTSVEALTDLRDVLGALHAPDPAQPNPAPVLREVSELVDEARAAGQSVELICEGLPDQAPTTHRLAVYRIAQEGLTNARKHAAGSDVSVRVDYRPPATLVEVASSPGVPGTSGALDADAVTSGYGLVGLRERVTALGGHLSAGPFGGGAWRLAARIPHPTGTEQNGGPS